MTTGFYATLVQTWRLALEAEMPLTAFPLSPGNCWLNAFKAKKKVDTEHDNLDKFYRSINCHRDGT